MNLVFFPFGGVSKFWSLTHHKSFVEAPPFISPLSALTMTGVSLSQPTQFLSCQEILDKATCSTLASSWTSYTTQLKIPCLLQSLAGSFHSPQTPASLLALTITSHTALLLSSPEAVKHRTCSRSRRRERGN